MELLLRWGPLLLLVVMSAGFSASETALFSLTTQQREAAPARVRRLLEIPRDLLVTVLLGNLFVNVFFFSLAARLDWGSSAAAPFLSAALALIAILILGEIVPKTLALRAPSWVASLGSWFLFPLVRVSRPVTIAFSRTLDLSTRALGESGTDERAILPEDLARVLSRSSESGLLRSGEAGMLAEIVELGGIRVREIMTPRVDALMLDVDEDPEPVMTEALRRHLTWLPVFEDDADHMLGFVRLRDLFMRRQRPVRQLVMPVKFVPEVAHALDLLREFREDRTAEAVVVDEWGGTAGVVTIEDVFEEIVGELRVEGEARETPVVPLGEGVFRVAGDLSIRDWNEEFGFRVVPNEFETVGGFVTAHLGRIPRAGDRARVGSLVFDVQEVRGRRILFVDMHVTSEREESA
jgi:putative hemolysin